MATLLFMLLGLVCEGERREERGERRERREKREEREKRERKGERERGVIATLLYMPLGLVWFSLLFSRVIRQGEGRE
jgi:hypothetical protein